MWPKKCTRSSLRVGFGGAQISVVSLPKLEALAYFPNETSTPIKVDVLLSGLNFFSRDIRNATNQNAPAKTTSNTWQMLHRRSDYGNSSTSASHSSWLQQMPRIHVQGEIVVQTHWSRKKILKEHINCSSSAVLRTSLHLVENSGGFQRSRQHNQVRIRCQWQHRNHPQTNQARETVAH